MRSSFNFRLLVDEIKVSNGFTMESDESERQKKLEAGKEKVVIEPCDVAFVREVQKLL